MEEIIPDDLQAFLRNRERLRSDTNFCEPGQIELLTFDRLILGKIWIEVRPVLDKRGNLRSGEHGYYYLPAINLVAKAEGYNPEFILLWLPGENLYGTWDSEHYQLFVFPGVVWTDIATNPRPYVEAQWEGPEPGVEFVPNASHPFIPGPLQR